MNASLMFVSSSNLYFENGLFRVSKYAFSLFYRNSPYKGLVVLVKGRGS